MKICNICNANESLSYGYKCKACHCEYQKKWYKDHPQSTARSHKTRKNLRRDRVKGRKENVPCTDCGKIYPWYVMDFDHVRGKKKFNLSVVGSKMYSLETIDKEIDKCDVVCANCHRIRTFTRLQLRCRPMAGLRILNPSMVVRVHPPHPFCTPSKGPVIGTALLSQMLCQVPRVSR